ncbi:CHAD domain-containing protein [Vitiosangium sp. GDMCC 1.1324]|uniref:CHAD domain-containing protein n=1 Tax=Vitiosangium sp. (strain GDMCC 1.1324) TaxID=2138576 RepID=UPI000D3922B7|nr:CHAD domain-containing protein [Vitiosangium sp. GDMCC 1.1324]PTL81676.1 metal-chelation protein CHAD [Vitiosangium sp. GDMCC 1.1324]
MPSPTPIRGLGPESRLAEAARRLLNSRLADVRHEEDALTQKLTEDGVHDMRVSTRRLRAALKVFRALGNLAPLERQVKQLQDALGEVRDVHVQGAWLKDVAREEKPSKRAGLEALRSSVESRLGAKEKQLRRVLARWDKRTVPAILHEAKQMDGPGRYGGQRVRRQLRRRLRKLERIMRDYSAAPDALIAHEMRKTVKKLRYEAELFRPALRRRMEALLEALVSLQELLGELHDSDVRLGLLEGFASEGSAPERTAARKLLERVRDERAERAARTARELQRWHAEKLTRGLRQLLD